MSGIEVVNSLNDIIWGPALIALCLITAIYYSFGTRFVQIRRFREMMRLLFKGEGKRYKTGTTSFQAFCIALSGRIGVGNIVGVATAIGFGGPGSIVWMWIIGLLGAATAFGESTLSQIYKVRHDDTFRGSPAQYICSGLGLRKASIIYAIIIALTYAFLSPPVQSNAIYAAIPSDLGISQTVAAIIIGILLASIICGGIKRIAGFAQIICPVLVLGYFGISIAVLGFHIEEVPGILHELFIDAFGLNPALGGLLGVSISWGVKRGIYSNEAGQGSGAIASGSAAVSHPVKQGLAQSFSIYIDTLLVCTGTAIMILACKTYNIMDPLNETGYLLHNPGAPEGYPGIDYTISAISTITSEAIARVFISIAIFFFAFTTIISYYYYAETNLIFFLTGIGCGPKAEKAIIYLLRLVICLSTSSGAIFSAPLSWSLGDIGIGIMIWSNLVAILLLSPKVFRTLRDYEHQKQEGRNPVFDPDKLGITGTECWNGKKNSDI